MSFSQETNIAVGGSTNGSSTTSNGGNSSDAFIPGLPAGFDMSVFAAAVAAASGQQQQRQLQIQQQQQQQAQQQQQIQQQQQQLAMLLASLKQVQPASQQQLDQTPTNRVNTPPGQSVSTGGVPLVSTTTTSSSFVNASAPSTSTLLPSFPSQVSQASQASTASHLIQQAALQHHQQQQHQQQNSNNNVTIDLSALALQAQLAALLNSTSGVLQQQQQQGAFQIQQHQALSQAPIPQQQDRQSHSQHQQQQNSTLEELFRSAVAHATAAAQISDSSSSKSSGNYQLQQQQPQPQQSNPPEKVPSPAAPSHPLTDGNQHQKQFQIQGCSSQKLALTTVQTAGGVPPTSSKSSYGMTPHQLSMTKQHPAAATASTGIHVTSPILAQPGKSSTDAVHQSRPSSGVIAKTSTQRSTANRKGRGGGGEQVSSIIRNDLTAPSRSIVPTSTISAGGTMLLSNPILQEMQSWPLEKLEQHIGLLQQTNQHIPHNLIPLLQEARRRAEKRQAKRIANRKSASTSRARKKALVKEMTELNARLKRQALILALLPDLVIVINLDGIITFCSAQVERALSHNVDDLVGSSLQDIILPSTRDKLQNLIKRLTSTVTSSSSSTNVVLEVSNENNEAEKDDDVQEDDVRGEEKSTGKGTAVTFEEKSSAYKMMPIPSVAPDQTGANTVGEAGALQSGFDGVDLRNTDAEDNGKFPLKVVKVGKSLITKTKSSGVSSDDAENDNSDGSGNDGDSGQQPSSLTASASSFNGNKSGLEVDKQKTDAVIDSCKDKSGTNNTNVPSSDLSNSSSNSTPNDATNLLNANANLERNVRRHNKKLMNFNKDKEGYNSMMVDDVLGDKVTANNASARLSSLQHRATDDGNDANIIRCGKKNNLASEKDNGQEDINRRSGLQRQDSSCSSNGEAEDDSGYRESNDSREADSSSSEWETKSEIIAGRKKPLAPTCNICLIRSDMTTLWCEVTSSIRSKNVDDDDGIADDDGNIISRNSDDGYGDIDGSESDVKMRDIGAARGIKMKSQHQVQEILLCLRPIRDDRLVSKLEGTTKAAAASSSSPRRHNHSRFNNKGRESSSHNWKKVKKTNKKMLPRSPLKVDDGTTSSPFHHREPVVSEDNTTALGRNRFRSQTTTTDVVTASGDGSGGAAREEQIKLNNNNNMRSVLPMKKRPAALEENGSNHRIYSSSASSTSDIVKRTKYNNNNDDNEVDTATNMLDASDVAESLMLMNKQQRLH